MSIDSSQFRFINPPVSSNRHYKQITMAVASTEFVPISPRMLRAEGLIYFESLEYHSQFQSDRHLFNVRQSTVNVTSSRDRDSSVVDVWKLSQITTLSRLSR